MRKNIVALCGGVGGAKLALGLASFDADIDLSIIANTGDDFEHLGLNISPDIDTIAYTLAGIANPEAGWGRADETWSFMDALADLGGETWFRLGDKDLALNVLRTNLLRSGIGLSEVTSIITDQLGISSELIPMSDTDVRTVLQTDHGALDFQDYFVRLQCTPVVSSIEFKGSDNAKPSARFEELLTDPDVDAFVICPSNPFISIDPILAIPTVRAKLADHPAPVVAISPLIGGKSVKGPTSKLMSELDVGSSAGDIAKYYGDFIDGFVLDHRDSPFCVEIEQTGIQPFCSNVVMSTLDDRCRLARDVVRFAGVLTA
ncbi:MAG: 2-phospho-L-lactate transferase [Gammaproteobacteria bacterium]|nr:2-phospho-L-lactate transferase [Gammaproteobacteria bacterium]